MKTKFSIIFLFFILNISCFAQDFKILSSDESSIIIEYTPFYSDTLTISSNGNTYLNFVIPFTGTQNMDRKGEPQLVVREINLGVQAETGNTIQVISEDYSTIGGKLLPVPQLVKDSVASVNQYYETEDYDKSTFTEVIGFGEFGLVRNLSVQTIKIFPIQFDASSKTIKLLKKVVFRVNYASVNPAAKQRINDDFLQALVINWQFARNWGVKENILRKTNSAHFASGNWYRFETPEEGIYKIDRTFLQNLGINVDNVDPRTIKIFSYGGYSLPEGLSASNNQGFKETAIIVSDESDGQFNTNDYILFYGRPTEFWEFSSAAKSFVRVKQPFSKKNYYWLTYGGSSGKRMNNKVSLNQSGAFEQTSTIAFKSYDKDSINIGKSGRDYLCDPLNNITKSRTYINSLNSIIPGSTIEYKFRVVNTSASTNISYRVEENGTQIHSANVAKLLSYYFGVDNKGTAKYSSVLPGDRSVLKFTLNTSAIDAEMYLDYFEIYYSKYLNAVGDNLLFFSKDTNAVVSYTLSNFSNSSIHSFDITDFENVKKVSGASISGGQFKFQADEKSNSPSKYIAVTESQFKTPVGPSKIEVVDLRSNVSGSEMIVITAKDFKAQAERYAAYRSSQSPNRLSTSVYYVDDILNEFSGGLMDPTAIRDFIKYAYENWQIKPLYVLLFGDGSFDYLNTVENNNNFVPTFQIYNPFWTQFYEIYSYPMDDYYSRITGNDNDKTADIAVGRLCVSTIDEAEAAVNKIIDYENNADKGDWRNRITLIADDGPAGIGADDRSIHTSQSELLSLQTIPSYIDREKIYLVAYPTAFVGIGRRKPDVNKAIINSINKGTLVLNYIGHGAPKFWAHEYVFETAVAIPQMTNKNYFLLTAATCDFGRFDDPASTSGTEELLNLENAGSIAVFTAARVVESGANAELNQTFYKNLVNVHNIGGTSDRIGLAYMLTKQTRTGYNDEKFHLFGDPAIRLNLPQLDVAIDSLNGKSTDINTQINALGNVKIKGTIRNDDNSVNPISGEAIISVFDSERSQYFSEMNYTVSIQGGLIYRGRVTVNNGEFETEFVVPKDISYENKKGKIVVYFYNINTDGVGMTNNFTVGGTNTSAVNDGKGPEIEIFFDNENFQDAYLVNPNFTLIAKLSDQIGINTTGTGIGHKLEGILNEDLTNTIDFSNYFVGDLNSGGKAGVIRYPFLSMEPGDYKIKVKAWDVFNNFSAHDAYFTVVSADGGIAVRDVYNYPNPFSSNTTFTFQHNIADAINVKIKIYTIAGRLIKQIEQNDLLNKFVRIDWDGRDEDGNSIANGTYLYKMIIESSGGQNKETVLGKLAVIK